MKKQRGLRGKCQNSGATARAARIEICRGKVQTDLKNCRGREPQRTGGRPEKNLTERTAHCLMM